MENNLRAFKTGNTNNEFRYFNFENMNTCYDYYQKYAETLTNKLSSSLNTYNQKGLKILKYSYKWDKRLNAGSLEKPFEDYILVNEGSILKIYNFFHKLNNRVNTVDTILPLDKCKEIQINLKYSNNKEKFDPINTNLTFSDNVNRNNIAEYMAMFTIKFLIAHEIGHAYNGHTRYYTNIRNEIKNRQSKGETKSAKLSELFLDLQTMEMDADAFGINRMVDELVHMMRNNDKILGILKNESQILTLLIYSIHGLFYMLRNMDMDNYKYKEHPPSFVREAMILDSMKHSLLKNYNYVISLEDVFLNFSEIERNINLTSDNVNDNKFKDYIVKFEKEAAIHAEKLSDNFKNNVIHKIKVESRLPVQGIDY